MARIKLIFLSTLFVLMGFSIVSAQSGSGQIIGTITDEEGNALIGANAMLEGTSMGAATDEDGDFIINQVPAGTYTLVISYVGYKREQATVEVTTGETVEYNAALVPESVRGEEVVVSAQARGQRQAINEQLSAQTIKNVVSAEKIRELPDENAATALSRLPGISLQEGDKVVIRGMEAKMNTVMVNGVQLPSTDAEDRSTNLGFISSNMLAGIDVTKAVTPDMEANSIGGAVNLRLKEAPSGLHFDVLSQGTYNTQDRTYGNYQLWASISNRFFNDNLGAFFQVNASHEDGGTDFADAEYDYMGTEGNNPEYGARTLGMDNFEYGDEVLIESKNGGSLLLDYRLPNGKLVMQNTYAYTRSDRTQHRQILFFDNTQRSWFPSRDVFDKDLLINSLQGENDFNLLKIDYGISHALSEKKTDIRYGDPGDQIEFFNQQQDAPQPFEPLGTEETRMALTPQDVFDLELNDDPAIWEDARIRENGILWDEDFSERHLNGNFNLTVPASFFNTISGEFKAGGSFKYTTREYNLDRTSTRLTQEAGNYSQEAREYINSIGAQQGPVPHLGDYEDPDYEEERGQYFLGDRFSMGHVIDTDLFDKFLQIAAPGWNAPGYHKTGSLSDDYSGNELLTAGYLMGDFNLGSRWTVLGGVRFEQLNMNYEANFVYQNDDVNGGGRLIEDRGDYPPSVDSVRADQYAAMGQELTNSDRETSHLFPNLQVRYKPTTWMDIRAAYTKTLSRPDFRAVLPMIFRQNNNGGGTAGNPYLDPSVSDNLDTYFSFHNNQIGLFTIGGFYKHIEDIFYQESRLYAALPEDVAYPDSATFAQLGLTPPNPGAVVTTYLNNPYPAKVYGLELEWQTDFWYLPRPFDAMVLNINYTRTFSEMDYQQIIIDEVWNPEEFTIETIEIDTFRTARLLYQGDHTVNVALGADYRGFSGRLSFRMQGDVITSIGVRPEEDAFTGNIYDWAFTIRQQLPVDGLSLFLSGVNIFHNPSRDYQRFSRGYTYERDDEGNLIYRNDAGEIVDRTADGAEISVLDKNIERNLRRITYEPRKFQLGLRYSF
ncbi:MAG: TonB-dependent receptor [Candidatus Marinimicrobia bacterium]|nr:TonB-dependent receptor [Candidatus Neomarinimicrobiota bacterium]MCF7827622.1 TonB-dependent receptor [Candidatus Neomarinimicrobiota bacterium]MCF7881323.1 TonB-dependent receptor [Candidatus Neomarinimicrobiota bacterium]